MLLGLILVIVPLTPVVIAVKSQMMRMRLLLGTEVGGRRLAATSGFPFLLSVRLLALSSLPAPGSLFFVSLVSRETGRLDLRRSLFCGALSLPFVPLLVFFTLSLFLVPPLLVRPTHPSLLRGEPGWPHRRPLRDIPSLLGSRIRIEVYLPE